MTKRQKEEMEHVYNIYADIRDNRKKEDKDITEVHNRMYGMEEAVSFLGYEFKRVLEENDYGFEYYVYRLVREQWE